MGLHKGAKTFARYKVGRQEKSLPGLADEDARRIAHGAFAGFTENDERGVVMGWIPFADPDHPEQAGADYGYDGFVFLGVREDKRSVPPALLKRRCAERMEEFLVKSGREYLSRAEKEELLSLTRKELIQQALPSTTTYDLFWDVDREELLIFGGSTTAIDACAGLFQRTFQRKLVRFCPGSYFPGEAPVSGRDNWGARFLAWLWVQAHEGEHGVGIGDTVKLKTDWSSVTVTGEDLRENSLVRAAMHDGSIVAALRLFPTEGNDGSLSFTLTEGLVYKGLKTGLVAEPEAEGDLAEELIVHYAAIRPALEAVDQWWLMFAGAAFTGADLDAVEKWVHPQAEKVAAE
ncbi:MAG: recombination-associated protein RdgC [Deltaproteobacteria bacterium]|nr:recombination-associated protein RdgC [Deltaproteobacteria bacterium]